MRKARGRIFAVRRLCETVCVWLVLMLDKRDGGCGFGLRCSLRIFRLVETVYEQKRWFGRIVNRHSCPK